MRLEIAAGDNPRLFGEDVIYCDARDCGLTPFVQCDVWEPLPFAARSFAVVSSAHVLEHCSHVRSDAVLAHWVSLLAPGGAFHVEVPNLEYQARRILRNLRDEEAVRLIYGYQEYGVDLNTHRQGFTEPLLNVALRRAGLSRVRVDIVNAVLIADGTCEG